MSAADHRAPALHRAIVSSQGQPEVVVFFEVPWAELPALDLQLHVTILLAAAWFVEPDDIQVRSLVRERPLIDSSCGAPGTGDMRLFEVGQWHGPIYAEPDRTLLLVSPPTLLRLVAAQRSLPIVDAASSMPMPL